VVHVSDDQVDAQATARVVEREQQSHRVGAARHRHEDAFAAAQHRVLGNRAPHAAHHDTDSALHSGSVSGTLRPAMPVRPRRGLPAAFALLVLLFSPRPPAGAEPTPAISGFTSSVQRELQTLLNRYGPDAVNLQGLLLKQSLDAGSQLEASCGIAGIDESGGRRTLRYRLDTGIVFKDPSTAQARVRDIWKRVLEPALRQAKHLNAEADQLIVQTSYRHADFQNRGELPALVESGAAISESTSFTLSCRDVAVIARGGDDARAAVRAVAVSIDERDTEIDLNAAP